MASKLPDGFVETANQRYIEANDFWRSWCATAKDDYAFISGDQWEQDDMALLKVQKRPAITFNYSEKMIDAVAGAEVSGRQEVTYAPREINDSPLAEMWTNAAKWARDEGDVEYEESDAFRDALICGLGWTRTRVSYETDTDGMVEVDRVDPLQMRADPAATKTGLRDRRYHFYNLWINEKDAKRQWPNKPFFGVDENGQYTGNNVVRHGHAYEDDVEDSADMHKGQVQVRFYECMELSAFYKVFTSEDQSMDVSVGDFGNIKDSLDKDGIKYVKMNKKTYYYGWFSGETFLEGGESPTQEGFTYNCITGKRDRNKNVWYGLTRVMKDPQRWANKWLSQILQIINANAKGGLIAELNAFVDPQKAQAEWAGADTVVFLKEGGIQKIKEKQMTNYPAGLDKLMEFALASLPQVTGINLEALGLASREQANVLEQSRKQAAYGLLAPVFDGLRLYRKTQGRVFIDLINNYISDGRMIRIGGPESQQFMPLRKAPKAIRYDIVIDQSPNAPDVKRETWSVLETLIPAAMKAGMPIPPTILKYAPLPTNLAIEWQQYIQQSQGQMNPEQVKKLQEENQKLQQKNQEQQMALKDKSQELEMKLKQTVAEIQMDMKKMEQEHQLKIAEMESKLAIQQAESQSKLALQQAESQQRMSIQQSAADATLKNDGNESDMAVIERLAGITQMLNGEGSGKSSKGKDE